MHVMHVVHVCIFFFLNLCSRLNIFRRLIFIKNFPYTYFTILYLYIYKISEIHYNNTLQTEKCFILLLCLPIAGFCESAIYRMK